MIVVLCIGCSMLYQAQSLVDESTGVTAEYDLVLTYALKENPADTVNELSPQIYGILDSEDLIFNQKMLAEIKKNNGGKEITVISYTNIFEMIDALKAGDIQGCILKETYVSLLADFEDYATFADEVKILLQCNFESEIDTSPIYQYFVTDEDLTGESGENPGGTEDGNGSAGGVGESETGDAIENSVASNIIKTNADTITLFISGIDTTGPVTTRSRSDVNIIAVLNTKTKQAVLVSTPRDFYVPLSISGGVRDKLTHAGIYGIQVSMDTLAMLYGIEIDDYFRVNFTGFVDIIDALGGVDVYSEYTFSKGGYSFTKGYNTLNGKAALAFCRERYTLPGGDRARGKNQMAVIEAVAKKAASPAILTNYSSLMNSLSGSFQTSLTSSEIASLVKMQLEDMSAWNIVSCSANGSGASRSTYSMGSRKLYVMIPDMSTVNVAREKIQAVVNGEIVQ
ncbi:MAG: LytR family transcriptional regulator [Lachnospiraceae bacterium]|nr:LytR family transcriptional regulator [Lachnospiraceae bacterium]